MNTYQIRRVLVPTDFSHISANALRTAIAICKRQLATLTLMHVVEYSHSFPPESRGNIGTVLPELVDIANENLGNLAIEVRIQHDLVVNHIVQSGNPCDEICYWANANEIDLIVMGSHGRSQMREFFMGSNAFRVVRHAPCPVMTIPGGNPWIAFKKILFPVRMIPNALEKYEMIRDIIRKNDSSLLVAGVVKREDPVDLIEMGELVDSIERKVSADKVTCLSEVYYCDDVAEQVLTISDVVKPDLIVITATLDSTWRQLFPGTYTQQIVNHAEFPVLSIRDTHLESYSETGS